MTDIANNNKNYVQNEISKEVNSLRSMDQQVQVLLDTQTRMEKMKKRMNDLVTQLGQGQEDTHSSPHP